MLQAEIKEIKDKLGRTILVAAAGGEAGEQQFKDIRKVLQQPSFVIETREGLNHYIALVGVNKNMLVTTAEVSGAQVVKDLRMNPDKEEIDRLIRECSNLQAF